MLEIERRTDPPFDMKSPLKFHAVQKNGNNGDSEQSANARTFAATALFRDEQKIAQGSLDSGCI